MAPSCFLFLFSVVQARLYPPLTTYAEVSWMRTFIFSPSPRPSYLLCLDKRADLNIAPWLTSPATSHLLSCSPSQHITACKQKALQIAELIQPTERQLALWSKWGYKAPDPGSAHMRSRLFELWLRWRGEPGNVHQERLAL